MPITGAQHSHAVAVTVVTPCKASPCTDCANLQASVFVTCPPNTQLKIVESVRRPLTSTYDDALSCLHYPMLLASTFFPLSMCLLAGQTHAFRTSHHASSATPHHHDRSNTARWCPYPMHPSQKIASITRKSNPVLQLRA